MNKPYEDLPTQGQHRGKIDEAHSGMNVRAPMPPAPGEEAAEPVQRTYQVLHHEPGRRYRLRAWPSGEEGAVAEPFQEVGRYTTREALGAGLQEIPEMYRFVVMENTQSGEVYFDRERNLTDDWTNDGRFDQITLFDEESEAEAYVNARQERGASQD